MQRKSQLLRITGRVQGVSYRASMLDEAQRLGLTGWVRNLSDGSVEALVQGTEADLKQILAWAYQGPTAARVDKILVEEQKFLEEFQGFSQWPTK